MTTLLYILFFIIGLVFGSFLNALEWRLKKRISLFKVRSKCPKCKKQIKWYDNIPLLSFIILKARCRQCKSKISWQYPLIELWMGSVAIFVLYFHNLDLFFSIRDFFIIFVLTFIFVYDFKYMEVLDSITLIPAGILFIVTFFISVDSWQSMLLGVAIGGGFFLIQFILSKGRWIGGGDIRIGILMGIILGWKLLFLALWIAYIIGAVVSVGLLIFKKKGMKSEVAFGTFLTVATFVAMFWGKTLLEWYLGFFS